MQQQWQAQQHAALALTQQQQWGGAPSCHWWHDGWHVAPGSYGTVGA